MAAWKKIISDMIANMVKRYRAWRQRRVVKWEDRYIIQYRKQIADALDGIEAAKQRRAKAARR